jgi:hypothetical protein
MSMRCVAQRSWMLIVDDELHISRSVWSGHVTDTKTLASRAPVPLLPLVKEALQEHRKRTTGDGYIFHGNTGNPLRLENVLRRDVKPVLAKEKLEWYGWHAFRRGVATNLHALGVDDKTISNILRHGNVAVTQAFYIKPVADASHTRLVERYGGARSPRTAGHFWFRWCVQTVRLVKHMSPGCWAIGDLRHATGKACRWPTRFQT